MRARLSRLFFEGEVLRLMAMVVLIKPIGLVTQMLMAQYYGASQQYDAYVLAFFLVGFVEMTIGRVFTASVVPYTIKMRETLDRSRLFGFQNAVYLVFLVPGIAYMLLLVLRGEWPLWITAHDAPAETVDYALKFLRWMAIPGLMMLVVAMLKSTLNLNNRFRMPAAMPVVHGVLFLATVILTHRRLGIVALPLAFAIGTTAQLLVLYGFSLYKRAMGPGRPSLPAGTLTVLWSLGWLMFVSTVFQTVNAFVDRMFASGLVAGSISSIAYSQTITNFGLQLFVMTLVTIMFTRMSEMIAVGDIGALKTYVQDNMVRIGRLVVPGALAMTLCSREIVAVLFERGAFSADDGARTSAVLAMYMLGLPAYIFNGVITRIYHSMQKMRAKMWLSLQFLLTNVLGNILLIGAFKVAGLAAASSIAINAHLVLSLIVLKRYPGLRKNMFLRILLTSYILAAATWALYRFTGFQAWSESLFTDPGRLQMVQVSVIRTVFVFLVYLVLYSGERRWSRRNKG